MAVQYEIFDNYCWTKKKKIITKDVHRVSGLGNVSYVSNNEAYPPVPMHYHSNIVEIHCIIKGKRDIQLQKNGKIIQYNAIGNQMLISFPFELHGDGNQLQSPVEAYGLQVNVSNPYDMLGLNREYSYALSKSLLELKHHHLSFGQTHIAQMRSAFNFFSDMTPESIRIGTQFLTCFLFNLQFLMPVTESMEMSIDPQIRAVEEFLQKNICENLRLSDLAEVSGYSLSHFKMKFKKEIGITPAEYLMMRKIEHAKKKLEETDMKITELAHSMGFSSSNYFDTVFKKLMACTPKEYRKQCSIGSKMES